MSALSPVALVRSAMAYARLVLQNLASRPISEVIAIGTATVTGTAWRTTGVPAKPFAISKARRTVERQEKRTAKVVVFVCHTPRAREAKIAYGLRSLGWKVVLLYGREPSFDTTPHFDETRRYRHRWQALSLACDYSPCIYHVFVPFADQLAETFIRHKPGRIILDIYDLWERFKNYSSLAERIEVQRYCIENADALCCRDLTPKFLERRHNYTLPKKLIFFPEYCWNREPETSARIREPNEIHVVLAGTFGVERRGFKDAGYLDIAETLADQQIHFHVFPHSTALRDKQHEADYVELAQRNSFVRLHETLPMDALLQELVKYDIGILVTRFLTFGEESELYDRELLKYGGSARISDYLDAGMPVICNKEMRLVHHTVSRYGIAVDGSWKGIQSARAQLETLTADEVKASVKKSRSLYSVQRNIGRLAAFYENL